MNMWPRARANISHSSVGDEKSVESVLSVWYLLSRQTRPPATRLQSRVTEVSEPQPDHSDGKVQPDLEGIEGEVKLSLSVMRNTSATTRETSGMSRLWIMSLTSLDRSSMNITLYCASFWPPQTKIRKIYKLAFHVEQDHNINYPMGWGLKTILWVEALKTILRFEAFKLS